MCVITEYYYVLIQFQFWKMTSQSSSSIEKSSTNVSVAFKRSVSSTVHCTASASSESSTIPEVLTTSTSSESSAFSTSGSLPSAGIEPSTSAGILSTTWQSDEGENLCHISCRISFVYTTMCIVHVFLMNCFKMDTLE